MAGGFQQVTIVGNLGREPEMRYIASGKAVVDFSVAVSTGSGDYEHTEWFNCQAWEKAAEIINQYAEKGHKIMVSGTLKTSEYEKDGEKKRMTRLTVRDFTLLGGRNSNSSTDAPTDEQPSPQQSARQAHTPQRNSSQAARAVNNARNVPVAVDDGSELPF